MNVQPLALSYFVDKLNGHEPVSIARYGDGEFYAILDAPGANCDGCTYFPELGSALRWTLEAPHAYIHCIAPKVMHRKNGLTEASLAWIAQRAPQIEWYDSEVFLNASLAGALAPFVQSLAAHKLMIVGPEHLRDLPLAAEVFVQIPLVNAWLARSRIIDVIARQAQRVDTILFSAGMLSKVLIHSFFPYLGATHSLIDCGSLWDMYCGRDSRSYASKLTMEEKTRLRQLNFGERGEVCDSVHGG